MPGSLYTRNSDYLRVSTIYSPLSPYQLTQQLSHRGATVIFQIFLFTLTVYKFIQAVHSGWGDVPLLNLLMRDGTWAFFLLFCESRLTSNKIRVDLPYRQSSM